MRRNTLLIAATFVIIAAAMTAPLQAQLRLGGTGHKLGFRGNRLNRFLPNAGFGNTGATLFDLYRSGQIPTPPYFSLHPPVYYNGIDYQRYGRTPFAYPYTWWQQFGYGYNGGPPPFSGHGPTAIGSLDPALCAPVTIENPHLEGTGTEQTTSDTATATPTQKTERGRDKRNADYAITPLAIDNPFVPDEATVAGTDKPSGVHAVNPLVINNPFLLKKPNLAEATELASLDY